jgi:hypothetical protein
MIVIGKRDLLEYIPRLVQSGKFMNVKAAMLTLARVYRGLMLLIHTKYPAFKLFIGRILTSRDDGIPAAQREAFQEMVRSSMPEEVGILI